MPSWEVRQIRRSLEACGIDETSIFPDLEALGRAVALHWTGDTMDLPHKSKYTRIQRSGTHGVGVFAICKIKKGTKLFRSDDTGMVWVSKSEIDTLPKDVKNLYLDFAVLKDGRYGCPPSFNQLTPAWHLNHSAKPNVGCNDWYDFFALRDIRKGEELTADYSKFTGVLNRTGLSKRVLKIRALAVENWEFQVEVSDLNVGACPNHANPNVSCCDCGSKGGVPKGLSSHAVNSR